MNKQRRKTLQGVIKDLVAFKDQNSEVLSSLADGLGAAHGTLTDVQSEEEEAYENLAEGFQNGDQGQRMREIIETLGAAIEDLQTLETALNEVGGSIDNAVAELETL